MARFLSSAPNELFPTPLQPKAQPAQASAAPNEVPTAPAPAGAGLAAIVDGKPCDLLEALQTKGVQTIVLGGSYKGPRQRYTPEDLRAIASADAVVEVLRVPPPPKVREDHTEADRLFLLKTAYSATHEKVMCTAYWRPKRAQSAKEQAAFLAAAEALLAKDLSPLSWARFSFSQWLHTGKKVAPTPAWVWNAARIEKHSGWCRSATGTLISASPVPVPATRALMQRLDTLRQRLGWGRPTGVVVSEILPEEELQQLLRQQAVQRIEAKKDMDERIRNGEWVWG